MPLQQRGVCAILRIATVAWMITQALADAPATDAASRHPFGARPRSDVQADACSSLFEREEDVAQREIDRRRPLFRAEIEALPEHQWAGEYYCGDGLGMNVALLAAPDAGFLYTWYGCLGLYDWNWGDIESFENGILTVKFDRPVPTPNGMRYINTNQFALVRWSDRRLLVPLDKMEELIKEWRRDASGCRFFPHDGNRWAVCESKFPLSLPPRFQQLLTDEERAVQAAAPTTAPAIP